MCGKLNTYYPVGTIITRKHPTTYYVLMISPTEWMSYNINTNQKLSHDAHDLPNKNTIDYLTRTGWEVYTYAFTDNPNISSVELPAV